MEDEKVFRAKFNQYLEQQLIVYRERYPNSPDIIEAILYGALSGDSKRIRPLLVYAVARSKGGDLHHVMPAAAAIEIIHCYSLIHDDLPAMDNDDTRRGVPSCHKRFSEALAILAGDIMQVIAFAQIMDFSGYETKIKGDMIKRLIRSSCDIVCGQAIDLQGEKAPLNPQEIEIMHQLKCGALIKTAMILGTLVPPCKDKNFTTKMELAGEKIGLAFQIRDDIIDDIEEGRVETQYKSTYPGILGMQESHARVRELYAQALEDISGLEQADTAFLCYVFKLMTEIPMNSEE